MKNKLQDLQPQSDKLFGIYRGVVECRYDPLFAGRIKVRIWGIHTQVKEPKTPTHGIPIEELPWAQPVNGIFQGSVNGYGVSTVPILGSHVLLFFENGNIMQPRYFASVPAIPEKRENVILGFTDPCDNYPKDERLEEPDFHRLAREDSKETCIEWRKINRHLLIMTATKIAASVTLQICDAIAGPSFGYPSSIKILNFPPPCIPRAICAGGKAPCPSDYGSWKGEGQPITPPMPTMPLISPFIIPSSIISTMVIGLPGIPWNEPEPFYDADYPHNTVMATHQGHLFEIDNSDCKRRIHLYHPSNTFFEISEEGNVTLKNKTDWIEIVGKTKKKFVWKDEIMSVDGNQSLRVGQNQDLEVLKDKGEVIHGHSNLWIRQNSSIKVLGHHNVCVSKNLYTRVARNRKLSVEFNNCKVVWLLEKEKNYLPAIHKYMTIFDREIFMHYKSFVHMNEIRHTTMNRLTTVMMNELLTVYLTRHTIIGWADFTTVGIVKDNLVGLAWRTTTGGFQHQLAGTHIALDAPFILLNCGVATPALSAVPSLIPVPYPFIPIPSLSVAVRIPLPYPESPDTKLPYKWY